MIIFDAKNSVDKILFMKTLGQTGASGQIERTVGAKGETEQYLILSALEEIEKKNEKNAIGLVNALFLSSTSQSLDKVCLSIFARMGDQKSLELLYRKYPAPESVGISLLPHYIRAVGALGRVEEIDLLSRISNTFWGLYRHDVIESFELIRQRTGPVAVAEDVAESLQTLFDSGTESEKIRVLGLCEAFHNDLLFGLMTYALTAERTLIRKAAIQALGRLDRAPARDALVRAMRDETHDELLPCYEPWLFRFPESENPASPSAP
jgi:hypothetical protein